MAVEELKKICISVTVPRLRASRKVINCTEVYILFWKYSCLHKKTLYVNSLVKPLTFFCLPNKASTLA